jgi:hypothetical protein
VVIFLIEAHRMEEIIQVEPVHGTNRRPNRTVGTC